MFAENRSFQGHNQIDRAEPCVHQCDQVGAEADPTFVINLRQTILSTFDDYRYRAIIDQSDFHHRSKTTGLNRDTLLNHLRNKGFVEFSGFFGFSRFYKRGPSAFAASERPSRTISCAAEGGAEGG